MISRDKQAELLALLVSRGHLSPRGRLHVEELLEHDLQPVQVIVGTRIVSPEVYEELLRSIGESDALISPEAHTDPQRAYPLWQRVYLREARSARLAPQGEQVWYMDETHPFPERHTDARIVQKLVAGSELPAFARRIQRRSQDQTQIQIHATEYGPIVQLRHDQVRIQDHPSAWLQSYQELSPEGGMTLYIGVDPLFDRFMQNAVSGQTELDAESFRDEEVIRIQRPEPRLYELIRHLALAGKTLVVHEPHPRESWWQDLAGTAVPVRIIHKQVLPEGESWVSYRI